MKITFWGAAGEVTGSCFHVELSDGDQFLVDAGYFQGHQKDLVKNAEKIPVEWQNIKHILLTHAHLDHCGRVPVFYRFGFRGAILATQPTIDIAEVVWRDNFSLLDKAQNFSETEPFFTESDIEECLKLSRPVQYGQKINLSSRASAEFLAAGHILGSATIKIVDSSETVVFSGDLGNWPMGIAGVADHPQVADAVVMESTYGNRLHSNTNRNQQEILLKYIAEIVKNRSTLLIPAFAIERTQELLIDLDDLVESGRVRNVPVFIDSPMANKITEITKKYRSYLSRELKQEISEGDDPFEFKGLKQTETAEESKKINIMPGPKIIIAGSGMMTGGRIIHHLKRVLPDPKSIILIVGYQVKGTPGREIEDRLGRVRIDDRQVRVVCAVEKIDAYSAHADANQLLTWFKQFKPTPTTIILDHGDSEALAGMKERINTLQIKSHLVIPTYGQTVDV